MSSKEELPSKVKNKYWLDSEAPDGNWTENSGKWLLFIPRARVDKIWKVIDEETKAGQLGIASKVATVKQNPLAKSNSIHVICVYTYDCEDIDDVKRVRQRLRTLGFKSKIPYKTDNATQEGQYTGSGKKVSLFYE